MAELIVVIGGSGYVGRNLIDELANHPGNAGARVVQISRSNVPGCKNLCIDLSAGRLATSHSAFELKPSRVYYLGRPLDTRYGTYATYHRNVQDLLVAWCEESAGLKQVVFTGSTMVYPAQADEQPGELQAAPVPGTVYEYFKLDAELFLQFLALSIRPDVCFGSFRLPIVCGGRILSRMVAQQFVWSVVAQYRNGNAWDYPSASAHAGTSWMNLRAFAKAISRWSPVAPGYQAINVSSGFFTYDQLHEILIEIFPDAEPGRLQPMRHRLLVPDQFGLEQEAVDGVVFEMIRQLARL